MVVGGHTHSHVALATMGDDAQREDLTLCADLVLSRCLPQPLWPFSYPYGQAHSFNSVTVQTLGDLGFADTGPTVVRLFSSAACWKSSLVRTTNRPFWYS